MTLLEIKTQIASYLGLTLADLTVNGQDMALLALNQVRLNAELMHDFNFQRKLLTLNINSVTGGSLDSAVLYGTATTAEIKTVVDVGQLDSFGNLCPMPWWTTEAGLNSQRETNPFNGIRYPTDAQAVSGPLGRRRFTITNNTLFSWPKSDVSATIPVAIEAYVFTTDWSGIGTVLVTGTLSPNIAGTYVAQGMLNGQIFYSLNDTSFVFFDAAENSWVIADILNFTQSEIKWSGGATLAGSYSPISPNTGTAIVAGGSISDIWTTKGAQYLQWAAIVELNYRHKFFVPRTEGNLAAPQQLADQGLQNLLSWDIFKYEGFRRHE